MKAFDRVLVDPRESPLQQALAEAAESLGAAGKVPKPRLPWPPDKLDAFLAELPRTPCGVRKWEGRKKGDMVPTVGVAWWTDTVGRRHLRLRADKVPDWWRETDFLWGVHVPSTPLLLVYPQAGILSLCSGKKTEPVLGPCGRHLAGREFRTSRIVFLEGDAGGEMGSLEMEPDTDYQWPSARMARRWLSPSPALFGTSGAGFKGRSCCSTFPAPAPGPSSLLPSPTRTCTPSSARTAADS